MALVISFMWLSTKSILWYVFSDILNAQDSGSWSNCYCYIVSWLFLSSPSTGHYFSEIPNWRPFLISCSWKWPSHGLCSPGMAPWTCLWLMACLQLHLRNQPLSPHSCIWKHFFPRFLFLLPLISSFELLLKVLNWFSWIQYLLLFSSLPLPSVKFYKTPRPWKIPTGQEYSGILPCHWD